ncbi:MAG: DUF6089 family protein [Bacteroidota bacterium]
MKKTLILIATSLSLLLFGHLSYAQRSNVINAGLGTSTYYGEMTDRFVSTYFKPAGQVSFQRYLSPSTSLRLGAAMGQIEATDALSTDFGRKARNLHFKSNIYELSAVVVVDMLRDLDFATANLSPHLTPYGFMGFGMFYHNPKARYQGVWYDLQPLGTEGQLLPGGKGAYSRFQISFPLGFGISYRMTEFTGVSIEVGYRITFTDYLDDVSTVYPSQPQMAEIMGNVAASLSMNTDIYDFEEGVIRGNPASNDGYMIVNFSFNYYLDKQ